MICYAVVLPNGEILQTGTAPTTEDVVVGGYQSAVAIEAPDWVEDGRHYWDGQQFAELPPRPGPWAVWDGTTWFDPRTVEQLAAELDRIREVARGRIVEAAARFERRFVTDLPGQAMKYARKEAEARAYLADPAPALADYPWVAAEVGVTAETAWQVAQVYVNLAEQWTAIATRYEPIRLTAVNQIEAAATPEDIDAALDSFGTAMDALVAGLSVGGAA